jgi:hypothetical protein
LRPLGFLSVAFMLALLGCTQPNARVKARFNDDAALTGKLPYNPFSWQLISSTLNRNGHSVSAFVGNEQAVKYARTNAAADFPAGSVICVITWLQQEDPRWFGGNIPQKLQSVEFLEVQSGPENARSYLYSSYAGSPLVKSTSFAQSSPTGRAAQLLMQRAAVMP